jgi:hypothetical protein
LRTILLNTESAEETIVTMQYANFLQDLEKCELLLLSRIIAKCNEESQIKNTCKIKAAGDSIFLLTFNLLYI